MEAKYYFLIYAATATVSKADVFSTVQWGTSLSNVTLDYQPNFSLERCILKCWREILCKSINYHGGANLCELNRNDTIDSLKTEVNPRSMYSEKSKWTQDDISAICSRRGREPSRECEKDSNSSYCPKPELNPDTEVILGNLARIGSKIRYACKINDGKTIYPVGGAVCQENKTWSDAWRPCKETGKDYADGKDVSRGTNCEATDVTPPPFSCCCVDMGEKVVVGKVVVELNSVNCPTDKLNITVAMNETDDGYQCKDPTHQEPHTDVTIQCRVPLVGKIVRVRSENKVCANVCNNNKLHVYTKVTD